MAFDAKSLALVAGGGGQFRLWHYKTNDLATDVDTAGYFNGASRYVQVGDVIIAHVDADGTPAFGQFAVVSNAAGVVDVANMVSLSGADTD